jgi:hypothetical protein
LPLDAAQQDLLHADTERRDRRRAGQHPEIPVAGPVGHLEADVAAEQVEGPVRHVRHAHQPEDQREAAGHEEVERAERQPVQRDGHELGGVRREPAHDELQDEDGHRRDRDRAQGVRRGLRSPPLAPGGADGGCSHSLSSRRSSVIDDR